MKERIVVLSPGLPNQSSGHFENYPGATYVGAEIRMDAAGETALRHPDADLYVVGGIDPKGPRDFMSPLTSRKTQHMRQYIASFEERQRRIVEVPSLPCTYHNFVALFNHLSGEGVLSEPSVKLRVLTNAYHIARAQAHLPAALKQVEPTATVPDIAFIDAESVLGLPHDAGRMPYPELYDRRIEWEAKGVSDIQSGGYTDSCFAKYAEDLQPYVHRYGHQLLGRDEREQYLEPVS
jgi:hypothetical protein